MAYAGKVEDMPPEERYSSSRIWALINQAVKKPWLREIFGAFLYRLEHLETRAHDIAVWEIDLAAWKATHQLEDPVQAMLELEPTKIWGEKHPFIPRKGEDIQIDHSLYEIVNVTYDLEEDYTSLLVVKLK